MMVSERSILFIRIFSLFMLGVSFYLLLAPSFSTLSQSSGRVVSTNIPSVGWGGAVFQLDNGNSLQCRFSSTTALDCPFHALSRLVKTQEKVTIWYKGGKPWQIQTASGEKIIDYSVMRKSFSLALYIFGGIFAGIAFFVPFIARRSFAQIVMGKVLYLRVFCVLMLGFSVYSFWTPSFSSLSQGEGRVASVLINSGFEADFQMDNGMWLHCYARHIPYNFRKASACPSFELSILKDTQEKVTIWYRDGRPWQIQAASGKIIVDYSAVRNYRFGFLAIWFIIFTVIGIFARAIVDYEINSSEENLK